MKRKQRNASLSPRRVGQALHARRAFRRLVILLSLVLSVFFIAALSLLVIAAVHGALPSYRIHFLSLFGLLLLGVIAAVIILALHRSRLGDGQDFAFRLAVLTTYVRGLLQKAYLVREAELLALPEGKSLAAMVRELAEGYELSNSEILVLMPEGGLARTEELIVSRYRELMDFMLGSPADAIRLHSLYREYEKQVDRWCRLQSPAYDPCHRPLIERRALRLLSHALFEHRDFLASEGTTTYQDLIPTLVLYADPERGEDEPRRIPKKEQYARYREILATLRAVDSHEGHLSMHGEGLAHLGSAIEAYDTYAATYTLAGEPSINIARYRAIYSEAQGDRESCFRCGNPRPSRYRRVCRRCGHYVCPRCGACFCKKRISHIQQ